jgi:hypothetical protein
MGMDVFGKAPKSPVGEYFRHNVWHWHPLARFICGTCPEEASACKSWETNDGDGLDADGSIRLAERLDILVSDGTAARVVAERDAYVSSLVTAHPPDVRPIRAGQNHA